MNNTDNNIQDLENLLIRIKRENSATSNVYKILRIMYIVLILLYIPIVYGEFSDNNTAGIIKMLTLFSGMFGFFGFLLYKQRKFSKIDYSLPTLELLKITRKLYRFKLCTTDNILTYSFFTLMLFGLFFSEKILNDYITFSQSGNVIVNIISNLTNTTSNLTFNIKSVVDFVSSNAIAFQFIIYVLLLIGSYIGGYFFWRFKHKRLYNNTVKLIEEIEG